MCLLAPLCVAAEEEAVVTLTKSNFDDFLKENKMSLVEFYAPWCGHCKRLAPEWEKAAQQLKGTFALGKVDATVERELGDKFGVRGYPTIKFFRNGKDEEYDGGRTADAIVSWVEKKTGPAVRDVTAADLEKLLKDKAVVFVATLNSKDSAHYKAFEAAADGNRDAGTFALLVDNAATESVCVHRKGEEKVCATTLTNAALDAFAAEEAFPLYGPINGDNFQRYSQRSQELVWIAADPKDHEAVAPTIRQVAKGARKEFSFVWLDTDQFGSHAENALGVSEYPALVVQKKAGRFVYPGDLKDAAAIEKFFADIKAGKVQKSLKSEPIPESNSEAVKVVVGKNFEEVVLSKEHDVMLEVYAPWCGHCKKLDPIYKEFAEKIASNTHVVIAKMDGTANESPVEGFDWSGFPTIFWVKAGATTPERYNGARTLEGLMEFVKKNASKEVVVKDEL